MAAGNMSGSVSASFRSVRRSRRPQTRLETSCTRTGRPRRFLLRNIMTGRREKAQAVRPCVYVCEESHRGIVPMSHSNKDGASSAESEEGRLRLKENALSSGMYPTPERDCACPTGGRACGQAIRLAAIHLREEPDALMSARPGLCGGHRATGVPTAIQLRPSTIPACPISPR